LNYLKFAGLRPKIKQRIAYFIRARGRCGRQIPDPVKFRHLILISILKASCAPQVTRDEAVATAHHYTQVEWLPEPRHVRRGQVEIAGLSCRIGSCADKDTGRKHMEMLAALIFHPLFTFVAGMLVALCAVFLVLNSNLPPNQSAANVEAYRSSMDQVPPSGLIAGSPGEKAALDRFTSFLQSIGDVKSVRENTPQVYSADAYLDDTLMVHHGAAEIEAYFVKTSETMTSYQVTIDDVARSGDNYYVRWTMRFAAPALSGGKPVHSVGISQVRFNQEGKVAFHQDFWDSGKNFYAHLPVVGGAVGIVLKRLKSN